MNLHLPDGAEIANADGKLVAYMKNQYEIYDRVQVSQDSTLTLFDILLSVTMNSRLDTADKVRSVWNGKKPVEKALAKIPPNLSLQNKNIPWDQLAELFDAFCGIRYAGPAVTTKILHKKRPKLIPIYDSIIDRYIDKHTSEPQLPRGSSVGERMVRGVKGFRNVLLECLKGIERLRGSAKMKPFRVSPVRTLEALLWLKHEPNGYYR